jgi:hypothetical protein
MARVQMNGQLGQYTAEAPRQTQMVLRIMF